MTHQLDPIAYAEADDSFAEPLNIDEKAEVSDTSPLSEIFAAPSDLSLPQLRLLELLRMQTRATAKSPLSYSRGMLVGSRGCHRKVVEALLRRGLVVQRGRCVDLADEAS